MYWHDMLTLSKTLSPQDVIINARDPLQNLSQTLVFYNVGQTRLTRAKCDPDNPDDPTRLQCCTGPQTAVLSIIDTNSLAIISAPSQVLSHAN